MVERKIVDERNMKTSIGRNFAACLALLLGLCIATVSEARPKTDRVTLANGDVITGEIKSLSKGYLSFSTDSMGTVRIEWEGVRALDSSYFFRLRTQSGKRYFGAVGVAQELGVIQVLHAEGTVDYPVMEIVSIQPIEATLDDRLDIVVSAGFSDFKASETTTTSLGLRASYMDELSSNNLTVRSVINDNSGETETSNRVDFVRQRLWTNPRHFNYYGANWESNDELAIDSRTGLAVGVGRRLLDSNRAQLALSLGVQALTEEDSLGETTESLEGLIVTETSLWSFDDPELSLESTIRMYPGITESGRFRADGTIKLSWEVIGDLDLTLSAFGNFDNQSNEEGDDYDYGITTGLEWSF